MKNVVKAINYSETYRVEEMRVALDYYRTKLTMLEKIIYDGDIPSGVEVVLKNEQKKYAARIKKLEKELNTQKITTKDTTVIDSMKDFIQARDIRH